MKIDGIKNIEVILEGKGQKLTTRTDEKGLYYFPVSSNGRYEITIKIPFPASWSDASFAVKEILIKEDTNEDARILNSTLTYEV